jgi:hypothetical protein
VLLHEVGDYLLVGFEGPDGACFVVLHESAVTGDVGAEDGSELAVKAFLLHGGTSALLKVHQVAKGQNPAEIAKTELSSAQFEKGRWDFFGSKYISTGWM